MSREVDEQVLAVVRALTRELSDNKRFRRKYPEYYAAIMIIESLTHVKEEMYEQTTEE